MTTEWWLKRYFDWCTAKELRRETSKVTRYYFLFFVVKIFSSGVRRFNLSPQPLSAHVLGTFELKNQREARTVHFMLVAFERNRENRVILTIGLVV